jgi:hypothetical protein
MPCTPFTLPGGASGILCTRRPRIRCACGGTASLQCDALSTRRSGTCDRHLCSRCAPEVGPDRHLCPTHARTKQPHAPQQAALDL